MFTRAVWLVRRGIGRHPMLVDALLGGALAAPALLGAMTPHSAGAPMRGGGVGMALFAWAAVMCRRQWPVPVLLITYLGTLALTLREGAQQPILLIALVVAVYTVTSRLERRRAWATAAALAVPLYLVTVLTSASAWWAPQNIGSLAWIGMAVAAGDATHTRLAYVAEVEERARRAEQTREQEAGRRVVEERIRIARELHDVVSHHIAVINVQAGAARHVLQHQPEAAGVALEHIRHSSDTVLSELGAIVGVLRQADENDAVEPTRGLDRLAKLLDTVGSAGLRVEHHRKGEVRPLPAVVDLAAYRILQEALTNAHKHGTGTVRLTVEYDTHHVVLDVVNRIGAAGVTGGYGLVGMRERALAAGGTVTTERRTDGHFRVHAKLPAPPRPEQS